MNIPTQAKTGLEWATGHPSERKAHAERARAIIQQLRDEMNAWLGWCGMSEPQAIGEYLVELTDMDIPLDPWLVKARKAYEEWKARHPVR